MKIKPNWIEDKELLKSAFEQAEVKRQEILRQLEEEENTPIDLDNLPELPPQIQALKRQVEEQHARQTPPPANVLLETLLSGYLRLTKDALQVLRDTLVPPQAVLVGTREGLPRASIDEEIREHAKEENLWVPVRAVNIDTGVKLQFAKPHGEIKTPPKVRLRVGGEEATLISASEISDGYSLVFDRQADVEGPMQLIRDEDGWLIEMEGLE